MNLKELKEIIDIFTSKDSIEELEVEKSGVRLRIKRSGGNHISHSISNGYSIAPAPPALAAGPAPQPAEIAEDGDGLDYITSPIVGTFYKSPTPTSSPFVSVGDFVEKGTVLCIIEAMKLMNEIESDVSGQIAAIYIENGQPVEYGEKLFAIRPR